MHYTSVLFDLDGTLLDTLGDLTAAMNRTLTRHGLPERTRQQMRTALGNGARRLMELSVPSGTDSALFETLLARPGQLFPKAQLEEKLYAFGAEVESNTIEVHVSRLRKKLGPDVVHTVRGIGYRLGSAQ